MLSDGLFYPAMPLAVSCKTISVKIADN